MRKNNDLISRQQAIDAVNSRKTAEQSSAGIMRNAVVDFCVDIIKKLPSAQPETATITIGRTKGGVTMWYECEACGEPIDICDCYCRKCGRKLKHE